MGIYGLIQYSVVTRTKEIGVRMAVGAQRASIFRMILGEGLKLALAGLTLGLVAAIPIGRASSSLLFGISASDPQSLLVGVFLLLLGVSVLACYLLARRGPSPHSIQLSNCCLTGRDELRFAGCCLEARRAANIGPVAALRNQGIRIP